MRIRTGRDCEMFMLCIFAYYFTSNTNQLLYLIKHKNLSGNWIKSVYQTTIHEYKEYLKIWNQGTGGGSGLDTMFETWSEEKLFKYHIDEDYDHTIVTECHSILMEGYTKKKKYLTCIFMGREAGFPSVVSV